MAGLLYKDFMATCRIRKMNLLWVLILTMVFGMLFRMFFPGTIPTKGSEVCLSDRVFVIIFLIFMVACFVIGNFLTFRMITYDEKAGSIHYYDSMPLSRHAYVSSKYIFLLLTACVFMVLESVWGRFCLRYCMEGMMADACSVLISMIASAAALTLLVAAFDIPLYLFWGKDKAILIKSVGILLVVGFATAYFLTHKVPSLKERFELTYIMNFCTIHAGEIRFFRKLFPLTALVVYALSWQINCLRFRNRKTLL